MTWDTHHRRGEVLRAVVDEVNSRRDGVLPMDLPGVAETYGDELALLGALQLRWHTRLNGAIERALLDQPSDPPGAVVTAWRRNAAELAGVRAVLDRYTETPASAEMALALDKARIADWRLLAGMAGLAGAHESHAVAVGRRLEAQARAGYLPPPPSGAEPRHRAAIRPPRHVGLIGRLRARLAA
jgi:hypothetical protein